jgi:phenylacetate-coenzyme A ligase PaaK-like adenylate-forming protein
MDENNKAVLSGRNVITPYTKQAHPFIRYDIGDTDSR